ncbi:NADH dehydrogenase subunit J [Pseudofulvimonas gallinarii]|uniref:NADH-quinone oxidoreductase subunit J n=1 Tax=Pseudofulvimonas gallinarii TaxID=634155 RepID=A0A4R3LLQ9_9GAMM|nr:NADH dehydrogenase subunit J [Pseudofulvimonas gallinarii]
MDLIVDNLELIAFYAFAGLCLASALAVISVRNSVHAALFLVLTFFSAACTWLLARAEFLGIALVLVYVGAVMVLFLFVVMMLDVRTEKLREGFIRYLPVGIVVAVLMLMQMVVLIGVRRMSGIGLADIPGKDFSNTEAVGMKLFTDHVFGFEIAAVILTVAIIAAIALTLRRRAGTKHQDIGEQVRVKASDRVRIVKMPSEGKPEVRQ